VGVPVALAARLKRVPILTFVPDVEPALALRVINRISNKVALAVKESQRYLPARASSIVTGYPLREELLQAKRGEARAENGWGDRDFILLVMGGSRGARSINRAILACLTDLLREMHVVHVSGPLDWPTVEHAAQDLPAGQRARYHASAYLHEAVGRMLAAADLVVSRAGGSILGEYPFFRLPAVLVPYPHAWRYQKVNAEYLAQRGAALILGDDSLDIALRPTVLQLAADPVRLEKMRRAAALLARSDAAGNIADLLVALAHAEGAGA
jgi:UDP-N-acetylglucosamine--N-acetylmuramyl-(pentapeptide) pyrophosphoryl-undecaprenol N-acetylglucosamine transferase